MKLKGIILLAFAWSIFSCSSDLKVEDPEMEVLPYFDLAGFVEKEISELPDSILVNKNTRVNWEQNNVEVYLSKEELEQEFQAFKEADINRPSFVSSYTTEVKDKYLIHELKEGKKGKLQSMRITYGYDQVTAVDIKIKEENVFYTSTTLASLYFSANDFNLDHYSIETTQKIRWMDPNNLKITGVVREK